MSYSVDSLTPNVVWKYFDRIRKIPHGSGNEKALGAALMGWAKEKGCAADRDEKGNVVIRIPATKGCEGAPTMVLQGHLDMVCEKNAETKFDFDKDPIALKRDGDWLMAEGTTLGADNAIGLAVGLAFMDLEDVAHGPLEILGTVEEETGLFGAQALKPGFLAGRMLFNLDSEEDGVFYVGCAGGRDTHIALPIATEAAPGATHNCCRIEVKGLRGGHSGLDIIQNRGNAVRLLARAIAAVDREVPLALAAIDGGDKHNAIPREAKAVVFAPKGNEAKITAIIDAAYAGFKDEFAGGEPEIAVVMTPLDERPKKVLEAGSRDKVLAMLLGLPHGVLAMVRGMVGMVETSTNMARVRTEDKELTVLTSSRSSVASALSGVIDQVEAVGRGLGATVKTSAGYPGWKPNMDSKLLARAKKVWAEVHGTEAKFQVIHAGLECGIIGEKYPGMDMISLGPTIMNPHSPDERVSIPSVGRFFEFVKAFVVSFAKEKSTK